MEREKFGSRLGFLLISAGCAIGIGNVWRFPYVAGNYGGGAFVLLYIFFLVIIGLPVMTMEFAVGRASKKSVAQSFRVLEKPGQKWHLHGKLSTVGNYLLMMFYTTVAGWMLYYFVEMAKGSFEGLDTAQVGAKFDELTSQPGTMIFWMLLVVLLGFGICSFGLQKGVERVTKVMMIALIAIMVVLAVNSMTLEGSAEGLAFYLIPDLNKMKELGILETTVAAMNQAFFTLSIGMGSMAIFGSYISRDRSLMGESVHIAVMDTFVALVAGLIIFPACFAYGVNPGQGPSLVFVTLPNIFNAMAGGRFWGALFFVFLSFAALSTVLAVFENILSICMDSFGWSRKKACLINVVLVGILSVPCCIGFNLLKGFQPLGPDTGIMDLEDFFVSNLILPFGSLIYLLFCTRKNGWGWKNFREEANAGRGLKVPGWIRGYVTYVLPVIILFLLCWGVYNVLKNVF